MKKKQGAESARTKGMLGWMRGEQSQNNYLVGCCEVEGDEDAKD
jgi:hypothetical protein